MEEKQPYDVIVVGAGAAGMMAAGTAARAGRRVLLIEKMEKSGRKVRITGKGRCNVTNARPAEEFASQVRTNAEFFAPAFAEFNNRATIRFFERQGVKLDIERGERVFPHSGKAWDIANALLDYCVENGVKILYDTRVTGILTLGDRVFGVRYRNKRGFERKEECAQVILATGGVSYPGTGSTGDGYAFASDLGHTIEPLRPSLTPLVTSHPRMSRLSRLLLRNVRATLWVDDGPVREEFGELGFSERGIEGAVALRGYPDPWRPRLRGPLPQQAGLRAQGGVRAGDPGHGRRFLSRDRFDGRRLCLRLGSGPYDRAAASVADPARYLAPADEPSLPAVAAQRPCDALGR